MCECLNCGKQLLFKDSHIRYMINPGLIIVPYQYLLCDDHQDVRYEFGDIYQEDGLRKKNIDHESIRNSIVK